MTASTSWGHDFEGGWGPFETVDMANAMGEFATESSLFLPLAVVPHNSAFRPIAGVEAVITTFAVGDVPVDPSDTPAGAETATTRANTATAPAKSSRGKGSAGISGGKTRPLTPEDMGDLVEYSFGDASTPWGKLRIETDGHPAIFNFSWIELGNEQCVFMMHSSFRLALHCLPAPADNVLMFPMLRHLMGVRFLSKISKAKSLNLNMLLLLLQIQPRLRRASCCDGGSGQEDRSRRAAQVPLPFRMERRPSRGERQRCTEGRRAWVG